MFTSNHSFSTSFVQVIVRSSCNSFASPGVLPLTRATIKADSTVFRSLVSPGYPIVTSSSQAVAVIIALSKVVTMSSISFLV